MTKNVAHSVRDRLLKLAKSRGEEFGFVLLRYGLERLLYRLTRSRHASEFVLKGAILFTVWTKYPHRATKDLDLLGSGSPNLERLAGIFRDVCAVGVEDDGIAFAPETVSTARIKEGAEYEAVRVTLAGKLGSAKLTLQVDVGFGDAITPEPNLVAFPTLLDMPGPTIRAYRRETVVAEKLHAMVARGMTNSRMKDFFDVWFLCREFAFDGHQLRQTIIATFERRNSSIPREPMALTELFSKEPSKQTQWRAFLSRARVVESAVSLPEVIDSIRAFLLPEIERALQRSNQSATWAPGGPWLVGDAG